MSREPVKVAGWIVVYGDGDTSGVYPTKEKAEDEAQFGAVVVVYVTGVEEV
jgi:hypothetical protein